MTSVLAANFILSVPIFVAVIALTIWGIRGSHAESATAKRHPRVPAIAFSARNWAPAEDRRDESLAA